MRSIARDSITINAPAHGDDPLDRLDRYRAELRRRGAAREDGAGQARVRALGPVPAHAARQGSVRRAPGCEAGGTGTLGAAESVPEPQPTKEARDATYLVVREGDV